MRGSKCVGREGGGGGEVEHEGRREEVEQTRNVRRWPLSPAISTNFFHAIKCHTFQISQT